jgi:hypothetical protein
VDADAAQEDRLVVQQDLAAARPDRAEPDAVANHLAVALEGDVVEPWVRRRPALGHEGEGRAGHAMRVRHQLDRVLVDLDAHALRRRGSVRALHLHLDAIEPDAVVAGERLGHLDEQHVAREAAVVPPVRVEGGHAVASARGVHAHHHDVLALVQGRRHLEIEGREAPHVAADRFAVDPDLRLVVRRPEVEERPPPCGRVGLEAALVPDGALVEQEPRILAVPVPGHRERRRAREVVLDARIVPG